VTVGISAVLLFLNLFAFVFIIQPVKAQAGSIHIRPDGSIDPATANITTQDNVTYTFTGDIHDELDVERDNIVVDGAGYTLQMSAGAPRVGVLLIDRINVTIEYVKIKTFSEGIHLQNSSGNSLFRNIITGSENDTNASVSTITGIFLYSSSDNSISENNITISILPTPEPSSLGISIMSSSGYNTISENTIENSFEGIGLYSSSNYVSGNTLRNNYYGIGVDSNNNTISENTVTSGKYGIELAHCSNTILSGNNVTENSENGIILYPGALSNVLLGNYIASNDRGIILWEASDNSIYHNSFVNNSQQVHILAPGYYNSWDNGYPSGGNYWSDYDGADFYSGPYQNVSGSDGIGDTSYVINSEDRDNYPLFPPEKMRDLMIEEYNKLESAYNDLQSKQETTVRELDNIRNLVYLFISTTIIFMAATVYLTVRRPRAKSESRTT